MFNLVLFCMYLKKSGLRSRFAPFDFYWHHFWFLRFFLPTSAYHSMRCLEEASYFWFARIASSRKKLLLPKLKHSQLVVSLIQILYILYKVIRTKNAIVVTKVSMKKFMQLFLEDF